MAKDVKMALRIETETHAALVALAEADRRTLTDYIRIALADHVQAVQPKRTKELAR